MKKIVTYSCYVIVFALTSLLFACSKDDDEQVTPESIGGVYQVYEVESYQEDSVYQLPSGGQRGEVHVTVSDDQATADLRIVLFNNNTTIMDETFDCLLKKGAEGDISFELADGGGNAAYFIERNEVDVYAIPQFRLSARK